MLKTEQLAALRAALKAGYLDKPHGMVGMRLIAPRFARDPVRNRNLVTGDYELTGWGKMVAIHYKPSVERLPVGAWINHRIHAYKGETVVLADDSGGLCTVDPSRALIAGAWKIPLKGGGYTVGSKEEIWYLRNLLDMHIELDPDSHVDDF